MSRHAVGPKWGSERTFGGKIVGREPLFCEPKGASDYCYHCGKEMVDREPCFELEKLRLEAIPDDQIAAFGCDLEAISPEENPPCNRWCHRSICVFTLKGPHHEDACAPFSPNPNRMKET